MRQLCWSAMCVGVMSATLIVTAADSHGSAATDSGKFRPGPVSSISVAAPAEELLLANDDLGAAIIRGLIEGAAAAERQRQREEQNGGGFDNGGGGRRPRPGRQNNDDEDYYYPEQQFVPQPQPQQPAAPPKPKPAAAGPYAIRPYQPNHLMAAAPTYPQASLRNQLMKELDAVNLSQVETVTEVLRSAGISDLAVRTLLNDARKGAGAGLDAELLRDLMRASAEKDATKVDELGVAMSLPDEPLELAVLATFVGELHKSLEDAVDPSDRRATLEVEKCVRKFQKKLRRSTQLEKPFRDGLSDKLDAIVAVLNARQELDESAARLRDTDREKLSWPTGEVWVLASPSIKPGSIYYITSDLILAGTRVPGMVNVMRSTVGSALGSVTYEQSTPLQAKGSALSDAKNITFINPPTSGRTFKFQLNGYDYELTSGAMYQFTNSTEKKIETFRYAGADGQNNMGFNLVEKDGKMITEGYFIVGWNGSTWSVSRDRSPPYVSMSLTPYTTPQMYLSNNSSRAISYRFNGIEQSLPSGSGRAYDRVTNWRLEFSGAGGRKAYTLAAGKSFKFDDVNGSVDLRAAPAGALTLDNSQNRVPFTYALGDRWYTIEPYKTAQHTFSVPPQNLNLTFDQGQGKIVTTQPVIGQRYLVGLTPGLQFALATDDDQGVPTLDSQRELALKSQNELQELAERMADERAERLASRSTASNRPVNGTDPARTTESTEPPATPGRVEPPATTENRPTVNIPGERSRAPSAHVLAVGVSKYANPDFNLKYADNDAKEFAAVFEKSAKSFFQEVTTEVLVNEEATKLNIEKALDSITKNVDDSDLVVLFLSAHGLSDDKRFYLCSHNVDPEQLISTAVKYSDIVDAVHTLESRDCRVIVLADTCNSGALGAGLGKKSLADRTLFQAHKDYSTSGAGAVLLASSADGQSSIERDEWQHGAFTKALLDTIADPDSDQDGDGMLYLDEIVSASRRRLRKLTDGKQRLPVNWPSEIQDFPLLKLPDSAAAEAKPTE